MQLLDEAGVTKAHAVGEDRLDGVAADERTGVYQLAVEDRAALAVEGHDRAQHRRRRARRRGVRGRHWRSRRITRLAGRRRRREQERDAGEREAAHTLIQSLDRLSAPITMRMRL